MSFTTYARLLLVAGFIELSYWTIIGETSVTDMSTYTRARAPPLDPSERSGHRNLDFETSRTSEGFWFKA